MTTDTIIDHTINNSTHNYVMVKPLSMGLFQIQLYLLLNSVDMLELLGQLALHERRCAVRVAQLREGREIRVPQLF